MLRGTRVPTSLGRARLAAASVLALAACSSGSGDSEASGTTLTVYAAASLKKPFTQLGEQFEKQHPGVHVKFNFAGSSDLAAQIKAGAPADVLATADERTMGLVTSDSLIAGKPRIFTTNKLTIVVPPANPKHIAAAQDLTQPGLQLVVCAPAVPCGKAAERFEKKANLTLRPVSEEAKVTDVLAKVSSGDAEAGLVYVSDAKSAGTAVKSVPIPSASNVTNAYPIGVLKDSKNAELAAGFNQLVLGEQGQRTLAAAGFTAAQ